MCNIPTPAVQGLGTYSSHSGLIYTQSAPTLYFKVNCAFMRYKTFSTMLAEQKLQFFSAAAAAAAASLLLLMLYMVVFTSFN